MGIDLMRWFRRKQKPTVWDAIDVPDPLSVVPMIEPDVEARTDEKQLLQLRRTFTPRGKVYGWISRGAGYEHAIGVNLDAYGTRFWELIDSRRTLGEIAEAMRKHTDAEPGPAREAAVRYASMLVHRRLLGLAVVAKNAEEDEPEDASDDREDP